MKKTLYVCLLAFTSCLRIEAQVNEYDNLYNIDTGLESRSISFENPTGEKGQGGKSGNHLGIGRKGSPSKLIKPGEQVTLCNIEQSGTIRHIWITGGWNFYNQLLRDIIIRAYWDDQQYPSIECPLGDLMGLAHGKVTAYQSAVHTIGANAALNLWLPMPFTKNVRITLTNESGMPFDLYYQIDYTIGDKHDENTGRLHVCFRRENPTNLKKDFEIMPERTGKGRYIGAVIGVRTLYPDWWGEGEIKIYKDGDKDFPTICGTGSEDYVGLSYGLQNISFMYHGCNLNYTPDSTISVKDRLGDGTILMSPQYISIYRWHLKDPIYWSQKCRITIQQIGWSASIRNNLFERQDDWSCATFWYEPIPSAPLPEMPSKEKRTEDLDLLFHSK
jgi:hypothetical protein